MQNQGTVGRLRRLASRLKGRDIPTPATPPTSSQDDQASQAVNNYSDREQSINRYKRAAEQLKEAIQIRKESWGPLDFEELNNEPESFDDSQLKNKISAVLASRETLIKDRKGWAKLTHCVECVFTAFSPVVKNLIIATKDAQSVMPFNPYLSCTLIVGKIPLMNPYGVVCSGLFLLITVALSTVTTLTIDCR